MSEPKEVWSAARLLDLVRCRWGGPEWLLLEEVRDQTGWGAQRTADAIALNMWPSRGATVEGVEVKASRHDWRRELEKPEKSEPIQSYCDRWWVVAPAGVVDPGELPATWGLLEATPKRLVTRVVAPVLRKLPLDHAFVLAILRRFDERYVLRRSIETQAVEDRILSATRATEATLREEIERQRERIGEEFREQRNRWARVEQAWGSSIGDWNLHAVAAALRWYREIAEAPRLIREQRVTHLQAEAREHVRLAAELEAAADRIAQLVDRAAEPAPQPAEEAQA